MAFHKMYRQLTRGTEQKLRGGETQRIDYKSSPNGVHVDDLVAFANTITGGEILLGVAERKKDDGAQYGVPVGCDVSDEIALQLLNKAISAIPPVSIRLIAENTADRPIIRVVIPASETRPHSTPKGTYLTRDGSRNRALHPPELLAIFLDSESRAFAARFEDAASTVTEQIDALKRSLTSSVDDMASQLGWVDSQLDDTETAMQSATAYSKLAFDEAKDVSTRLRALFRQDEREDPVRQREHRKLLAEATKQIRSDEELLSLVMSGGKLQFKALRNKSGDVTDAEAEQLLSLAIRRVRQEETDKRYEVSVKPTEGLSDNEFRQFVACATADGAEADSVNAKLKEAWRVGLVKFDDSVVGTAAITRRTGPHRSAVFKRFGCDLDPNAYPYELTLVSLDADHHGKGQMSRSLRALLPELAGDSIYAMSSTKDELFRSVLDQSGFHQVAVQKADEDRTEQAFHLYVYDKK